MPNPNKENTYTPGGNPVCPRCGVWYVVGREHDCVEDLTRRLQATGPDEYPEGYYRHLAEEQLKALDEENAS